MHMRHLIAVSLLAASQLAVSTFARADAEHVSRVVVYPDRAQVSRVASVACGGRVVVRFSGLPPAADAGSLRAQATLGHIEGLRSESRVLTAAYAKKIEDLDEQIAKLEQNQRTLREQQSRDDNALQLAGRYEQLAQTLINRELPDPQGAQGAQGTKAWSSALDLALKTRLSSAMSRSERKIKQSQLDRLLSELRQSRYRQQAAASRRDLLAEVLLVCPAEVAGQASEVELSYVVGGAGFSTEHEARLEANETGVHLTSYATIVQNSGEDWRAARVTLSTAVPRQNATPPNIALLRVYADPREPPKRVLVSRQELHEHAEAPAGKTVADDRPMGGKALPQRQDQGLSVQFTLPAPADILGDGTPNRLVFAESKLPARLSYRTAPKLLPYVFRVADLVNGSGYPLIAGPIDVFRKGQFIARYALSETANGARFQLTFGLEDRFKVKRNVIEEIARDKGWFGGTRRHRYVYRFEVTNYLDRQDEIELAEHIPISELDDIKVALAPETTPGYKLNSDDGIVTWRLPLRPGEKRLLSLSYFVDVPSSYVE